VVFEAKAERRAAAQLKILEERLARLPSEEPEEMRRLAADEMRG
jgi:hypothetical protein